MNLVDSSGWLEYFGDTTNASLFAPVIEKVDELVVSVINLYEVYKKILIEADERSALDAIGIMQQARIIDIDSSIAIYAARFSFDHKLPMADSLIFATARLNDSILWTMDSDFKGYPDVRYYKK